MPFRFAERTNWNLAPNRLSERLARHRVSGKPLLDLTVSNPTKCGFSFDSTAILGALQNPQALQYGPDAKGLEVARRAIAAYYADRGAAIPIEDLVVTTSTSEAYSYAFPLLCDPADEVLIPSPSYPLFSFLADIQDVNLVRYPLLYDHGWQIDFHALEQAITTRTRAVIVVNPNNPTGNFVKPDEIARLNELCAARELAVIADEVFLDFNLDAVKPTSFAGNRNALTFTISGLSKISGLPQMKLAWMVASGPTPLKQQALARLEVMADTYLSPSTPVQLAAPVLLEQRHTFQPQLMARVLENVAELDRRLGAQKVCSRQKLEGGWYAVLQVPATRSDEDLAIELLETRDVYVHPGHFYDFAVEGYLVVSTIAPNAEFAEGIRRVLSMF